LATPYGPPPSPGFTLGGLLRITRQFIAGPMDIGLHCSKRQLQSRGDFLVGIPLHVPQQDAGAVLRRSRAIAFSIAVPSSRSRLSSSGVSPLPPSCNDVARICSGVSPRARPSERQGIETLFPQVIDRRVVRDLKIQDENFTRRYDLMRSGTLMNVSCARSSARGDRAPSDRAREHRALVRRTSSRNRGPWPCLAHATTADRWRRSSDPVYLSRLWRLPPARTAAYVRGMFTAIAPRYDFLNHLAQPHVRSVLARTAVARLGWEARPTGVYLDLCAGTLDLAASWRAAPISAAPCSRRLRAADAGPRPQ